MALLWKMICNLGDPMSLRHPVSALRPLTKEPEIKSSQRVSKERGHVTHIDETCHTYNASSHTCHTQK